METGERSKVARPNRVLGVAVPFVVALSLPIGCGDLGDDCLYLKTCGGDTGGTRNSGGSAGSVERGGSGEHAGGEHAGGAGNLDGGTAAAQGGVGGVAVDDGNAAAGGIPACNDACAAPTPVCDDTTRLCVACTLHADCNGATPLCDVTHHACVACLQQADCADATASRCDLVTHTCAPCVNSTQCSGIAGKPTCSAGECVECSRQSDCKTPGASHCDLVTHTCKPCSVNSDCSDITGKNVCLAGECVQCIAAQSAACGTDTASGAPYVCDSLEHTCTTQKAKSAGLCASCVSDAQCKDGELCVLDTIGTGAARKPVGYFCHWKQGDTANGAPADCTTGSGPPYVKVLPRASSIDGAVADVCVLRRSSCPARADFSKKDCAPQRLSDDSLCGFAPPQDAKCAQFGTTTFRCTMTCLSDIDCPGSVTCLTDVSPNVCAL